MGYSLVSEVKEEYTYLTPEKETARSKSEEWMMQKVLSDESGGVVTKVDLPA